MVPPQRPLTGRQAGSNGWGVVGGDDVDPADDPRRGLPVPDVLGGPGRRRPRRLGADRLLRGDGDAAGLVPRLRPGRPGRWPRHPRRHPGQRGAAVADARDAPGPGHRRPARPLPGRRAHRLRRPGRAGEAAAAGGRVRPDLQRTEVGVGGVGAGRPRHPGGHPCRAPAGPAAGDRVRGGAGVRLPVGEGRVRCRRTCAGWSRPRSTTGTPGPGTRSCTPTSW